MAATNYTPIQTYYSTVAGHVPVNTNLVDGELAINTADGKLFYKDSGGTVQILATKGTAVIGGSNTQIQYNSSGSFAGSANFVWDNSNVRLGVGTATPAVTAAFVGTDAMLIPKGTTAQEPTGVAGYLRFNTDTTQFEGYNGTAWASVGGSSITNDTTTSSNLYPIFVTATTGTALNVYTSNAKYLYKPSTGELQAPAVIANNGMFVNSDTISVSYSIPSGSNAMSAGPVTVASGVTVTVPSGNQWTIV